MTWDSPSGDDRHRPANRLASLGSGNSDRERLPVLRVIYREQLGLAHPGHRIGDCLADASIHFRLRPVVKHVVAVIRPAYAVGGRSDSLVERGRTLRVRYVEISEFHNYANRLDVVGSRANYGKARGKSADNCSRD